MRTLAVFLLLMMGTGAEAASQYFSEPAGSIRFEQYTGGTLALWRMPSPGSSTFPNGNCKSLVIPGDSTITNRFYSLYLYLKANGGNYFIYYETSNCQIVSFGIDG